MKVVQTKTCFKCGTEKPLKEFYRHKYMADGRLNKCKDCTRKYITDYRARNIDKVRAYDRERGKDRKRINASVERNRRYRRENPEKSAAHNAANRSYHYVRKQPCFVCGEKSPIEGHHEDYSRPLDILWLCSLHHKAVHHKKICLI